MNQKETSTQFKKKQVLTLLQQKLKKNLPKVYRIGPNLACCNESQNSPTVV